MDPAPPGAGTTDPRRRATDDSMTLRILTMTRATPHHRGAGGMELAARTTAEGLAARGHSVTCLTTAHPEALGELEEGGVSYRFLAGTPPGIDSPAWAAASARWVRAHGERASFEVILGQSGAANGYLLEVGGSRSALPAIAIVHGITPWNLRSAWLELRVGRGLPRLARMGWQWIRDRALGMPAARCYQRFLVVSLELVGPTAHHFGVPPERVRFVPNGVDPERFRPRPDLRAAWRHRLDLTGDSCVALQVSRLVRGKGLEDSLAAMTRPACRSMALVLAGSGPLRPALEDRIRRLGLGDRVRLPGRVAPEDLPGLYAAADVLAFPSRFLEALPLAVLEAMACGLPVIATRLGGIPTLVEEGVTGRFVPVGDPAALARTLGELAADPARREAMGSSARRKVEADFSLESVLARIEVYLEEAARTAR